MNPEASSYQHGLLCQLFVLNILKKSWKELSWFNNHQKVINFDNTTRILQAWWRIKGVKSVLFKKSNQKQLQTSESYFLTRMIQHNFKEQEMIQCNLTSKMNVSKKWNISFFFVKIQNTIVNINFNNFAQLCEIFIDMSWTGCCGREWFCAVSVGIRASVVFPCNVYENTAIW